MRPDVGRGAVAWWRELHPSADPVRARRVDRGALPRLRRCDSVVQAASEPAALALCRRLGGGELELDRAALVACVLAHVREDATPKVARQIGVAADGTSTMSGLRFRRLIQADTDDERLTAFRRLVALAGGKLNVADLADSLWYWGDERRRRWMYAYYDAPDFTPTIVTPATDEDASA